MKLFPSRTRKSAGKKQSPRRSLLRLEPLEPRTLLSITAPVIDYQPNGFPIIHSKPDAPVSIFIDYQYQSRDGEKLRFDSDGSPNTYNPDEQDDIIFGWAKTASAYAPFDVDVTTEFPDADTPFIWAAVYRLPTGPGGGGGARTFRYMTLDGYQAERYDATAGRVEDGLMAQSWIRQGSVRSHVIVHETGHSHGVSGHETTDTEGNKLGIQNLPIERGPFTRSVGPIGGWYDFTTEWAYQSNPAGMYFTNDDMQKIADCIIDAVQTHVDPTYTGDGFDEDDHTGEIATATPMTYDAGLSTWIGEGIIERWTDTDMLSFDWGGGTAWIGAETSVPSLLLDVRLMVYDAAGNVVGAADPSESMQAALRLDDLPAGTYYLEVASDGDYSELGAYEIEISEALPSSLKVISQLSLDGNSLADSSGQDHDGTWSSGSASWTTSWDGTSAARLTGSNRILVQSPEGNFSTDGISPLGRTFGFWFKADNVNAAGQQTLFEDPTAPGYKLYIEDGRLKAFAINDGGLTNWSGGTSLDSGVSLVSGQWYHAALTHRTTFSVVPDTIALYLDGEEVARGDAGPVPYTDKFYVGSTSFQGAIDDVQIFGEVVQSHLIAEWADRPDLSRPAPTGAQISTTASVTHDPVTHGTVQIDWAAAPGATGYEILRSLDNQHFARIATVDSTTLSYTDTGLQGSRNLFYRVNALEAFATSVGVVEATTRAGAVDFLQYVKVKRETAADDYQWCNKADLWGHHCEGLYGIALNFFGPDGHRDTDLRIDISSDGVNYDTLITLPANEMVYYANNLTHGSPYTFRLVPIDELGPVDSAATTISVDSLNFEVDAVDDNIGNTYTSAIVAPLANDTDWDNDPLSIVSFTQANHGTVTDNGNGTLTYAPDPGRIGGDQFTYTVSDGFGSFDTATVRATVILPPNVDPVAEPDSAETLQNTGVTIDVLANDSDENPGDVLSVTLVTQGANGSVELGADDIVTYWPNIGFIGTDSFTYTISDGMGGTAAATVTVDVVSPTYTWQGGDDAWAAANWHDGVTADHQPPANVDMIIDVPGSIVTVEQDFLSAGAGPARSVTIGEDYLDGHDVAAGEAEAFYDPASGELFFDVGEDVAVVGIGSTEIYSGNVDTGSIFGNPAQNDGTLLAYFNTSGLPVGEDSVGLVLPVGLAQGDIVFSYTPVGNDTVQVPVALIGDAWNQDDVAELAVNAVLEATEDVTIGSHATLSGTGTVRVGDRLQVAGGATVAPGNSLGTLSVDGDMVLGGGSVTAIELSGSGSPVAGVNNDLITADDVTLVDNPTLELEWLAGKVGDGLFGGVYTIATYSGVLAGTFAAPTLSADFSGADASIYIDTTYGIGGIDYGSGTNDAITVKLNNLLVGDANLDGDVDVFQIDGKGDAQVLSSNLGTAGSDGHNVGVNEAEALYNPATGELFFDVGENIAVVGIGTGVIYSGNVDTSSLFGTPSQNDGTLLAYFDPSGLPVGEDNVGPVLPTGLSAEDISFSYTPVGSATVQVPVKLIGLTWSDGDFNFDGDVDVFQIDGKGDAQLLSSNLGASLDIGAETVTAAADVAEPNANMAEPENKLRIYLLAGQSNMEGHGYSHQEGMDTFYNPSTNPPQMLNALEYLINTPAYVDSLPASTYTFKDSLEASWLGQRDDAWAVHYQSGTGQMRQVEPTPSTQSGAWATSIMPLSPGFGANDSLSTFGPELAMGTYLADRIEDPVFLFKSDRGGTRIDTDWRPPSAGGTTGNDYLNTVNRFSEFLDSLDADLADDGVLNAYNNATDYQLAGFVWLQGWNNRGDSTANKDMYREMLVDLTHDVRALPGVPYNLPLIAVDHPQGSRVVNPDGTYSGADGTIAQARREAVELLNAEIPDSAVYVDVGPELLHGYKWGYHWEGLAENYLEAGWRAGQAIYDAGFIGGPVVNLDPEAVDDSVETYRNTAVVVDILANDRDLNGDPMTLDSFTQGTHGTVTDNGDGTLTYTPTAEYIGGDQFSYTISDGNGGSGTALVTLDVVPLTRVWQGGEDVWTAANWTEGEDVDLQPAVNAELAIDVAGSIVQVAQDFTSGGSGPARSVAVGENQPAELAVNAVLETTHDVTIGPYATLSGTGAIQVGNQLQVAGGGTLAPGSGIGALTVEGDVVLSGGSTLAVELSGSGVVTAGTNNDLLAAEDLTLSGSPTLELAWLAGNVGDGRFGGVYTIATYSGTLTGTFASPTLRAEFNGADASAYIDTTYGVGGIDYGSGTNDAITVKLNDLLVGDANLDGDVDVFQIDGNGDAQVLSSNLGVVGGDGHDVGPQEAEALYNPTTGELFLDAGEDVSIMRIVAAEIFQHDVDATSIFGLPAQNNGTSLTYYSASGLPVGEDSVGPVLPTGLLPSAIAFSYAPVGGEMVSLSVGLVGADWSDGDFNFDGDVDVFQIDGNGDAQLLSSNLGAALDIVFEQTASLQQDADEALPALLDWQEEFDAVWSKRTKKRDTETAIDMLLSIDYE